MDNETKKKLLRRNQSGAMNTSKKPSRMSKRLKKAKTVKSVIIKGDCSLDALLSRL